MAGMPSHLPGSTTIRRHYKNIPVAVALAAEGNPVAVRGENRVGIVFQMES